MPRPGRRSVGDLRRRVYEVLERGAASDRESLFVDRCLVALIILNLTAVVLESIPVLAARYRVWFDLIEYGSLFIFTAEYALRVWVAVETAGTGRFAPDFTVIAQRRSPGWLRGFLRQNHLLMPDFVFKPDEAADIVAYIVSLKQ